MATSDDVIPAPTSLPEVGIHLSYIRRDIREVGSRVEEGFRSLDDHFVAQAEFDPVAADVKALKTDMDSVKSWKENMNGRMIGFSIGISACSAVGGGGVVALLVKLLGG